MRRLAIAALLALSVLCLGARRVVVLQPPAAPPAGCDVGSFCVGDDFEDSATESDWTAYVDWTSWEIDDPSYAGRFAVINTGGEGSAIYTPGSASGAAGYVCVTIDNVAASGPKFRAASDDSNTSYIVRYNASKMQWRYCDYATCADVEFSTGASLSSGEAIGVRYDGTGASTTVDVYVFNPTDGCSGATGGNCDAQGCDVANWSTNADHEFNFTCDAACQSIISSNSELNTNRYYGLYNGNSTKPRFYDFYAGDE